MGFPKKGLYFEDARNRLLRYKTAVQNPNMREALIDDACMHEGPEARRELEEEFSRKRLGDDRVRVKYKNPKAADTDELFKNSIDPHGLREIGSE